jgi:uncharacterized protein (TIGR02145 family)
MKNRKLNWTKFLGITIAIIAFSYSCSKEDDAIPSLKDIEGNTYKTVKIGDQIWMAENLKVTKFRNGDPIQYIADAVQWGNNTAAAFSYYDNISENRNTYGLLYNLSVIKDSRNIAPEGWKVPSDDDWEELIVFLGTNSGVKLREIGNAHWAVNPNPNSEATNSSGFTALPGGFRKEDGRYMDMSVCSYWWSTSLISEDMYIYYYLSYGGGLSHFYGQMKEGYSIRCLKE